MIILPFRGIEFHEGSALLPELDEQLPVEPLTLEEAPPKEFDALLLKWATKIAERYMGKKNAETYGRRNSSEGAVLVRINPTRIIAEKDQ